MRGKLRHDPVHRALLQLARRQGGLGDVVDAGCGAGQLGILLLEAGLAGRVAGLDRAPARLADAGRAAAGLPFTAERQDFLHDQSVPACDTVLLVDVLYQLPRPAQEGLLRNAARAARRRVLVRTLDPDRGWRSALTLGFERVGRWCSAGSERRIEPPRLDWLVAVLADHGFAATLAPCWQGTPFANVLLHGRKDGAPGPG